MTPVVEAELAVEAEDGYDTAKLVSRGYPNPLSTWHTNVDAP
ncbi:MAG TPA: hypothetical protein VHJ83_10325 [Micromonosporaceae bacterium]|nr:hypothetical protein [Micromonosporaceae bacterium]